MEALRSTLRELGYVEGKNLLMEVRYADGKYDRLAAMAAQLVELKVDVILAVSSFSVEAARRATSSIPIVMTAAGNPIASGFVKSLSRPGGNITGVSNVSVVVSSKYLELLHAAVPRLSRVAVLVNPVHPNHPTVLKQIQATAKTLDIVVVPVELASRERIGNALTAVIRERANALIVPADPFFNSNGRQIAAFAIGHRLPTMFGAQAQIEAGALMSYDRSIEEENRRAAFLIDKILRGANPAELPVELPSQFELAVNLKTAKALGLTIPQEVLLRANRVVE